MLATVGDIIDRIYWLLSDVAQERYTIDDVYNSLNEGLVEAKRIRPDFWRGADVPQYGQGDSATDIDFPDIYRPALVNYAVGRSLLQDREDATDQRAAILLNTFTAKLTVIQA